MSKYKEIDLSKVRDYSIADRQSKVNLDTLAKPVHAGGSFSGFLDSLPQSLKAADLKALVSKIHHAKEKGRPILVMMGAHLIKTGISPILIDLMKNGFVQGIAMNGAGAIHDTEMAYFGSTSEDVAEALKDGSFGMVKETSGILNRTLSRKESESLGFGEAIGQRISDEAPDHASISILAHAYQLSIPVTVHVALGTDIVHQHPSANGEAIGRASLRDFRIFCNLVSGLGDGGVLLSFGSAVLMPEVFLKALTVARNIHGPIQNFTTANFDMIRHYRPENNIVRRPTQNNGTGYVFTGHHEIMLPLLAAALKERCKAK